MARAMRLLLAMLHGSDALNQLSERIIGCAIEVHRELGPGLLESVYETALCIELGLAGVFAKRQVEVPVFYKGRLLSQFRIDLIVNDQIVLEVKAVERFDPIHVAKLMTYLRITNLNLGLLLNFNSTMMRQGIKRVML
jgi:GxxExxY protein